MTQENKIPNPGSEEAIKMGCLCPIIDNHHGKGVPQENGEPLFWYIDNCPLHSTLNKRAEE